MRRLVPSVACLALSLAPAAAQDSPAGAGYRLSASTWDGGTPQVAGHAGSGYRLTATVGQPDAALASNGALTLLGGFWPAAAALPGPSIFANGFEE